MSEDAVPSRRYKKETILLILGTIFFWGSAKASSGEAAYSWGQILGQILLIVVLTVINAFFAASEMAMVSLDQNRLRDEAEDGDKKAIKIIELLSDQSRFLSTIQVCITLAGFFNAGSAATGIAQVFGNFLASKAIPYSNGIAQFVVTILLSYLTIVFGELVPKRIALSHSEEFARSAIGVLSFMSKILSPFVSLLSKTTNGVLTLMGVSLDGVEEKVTIEEIRSMVQVGQDQGLINPVESEMINSVITFDDKYAEEIMTPRTDIFMIDIDDPPSEWVDEMLNLKHSRIPVYEEDVDNIIGILYMKDYLAESYKEGFDNVDIRSILRKPYFVPERKNINELFNELQTNRWHMAILIDEYGGFAGIVTMEDLIEEIVGDIDDEYDYDIPELRKIDKQNFICKGTLSIKELNFRTGTEFDEDSDHYDTLGGLVIYDLGYIPSEEDHPVLEFDGCTLEVKKVDDNRVETVKVILTEKKEKVEDIEEAEGAQ